MCLKHNLVHRPMPQLLSLAVRKKLWDGAWEQGYMTCVLALWVADCENWCDWQV